MSQSNSAQGIGRRRIVRYGLLAAIVAAGLGTGLAFGSWTRACAGGNCPSIAVLDQYRPVESSKIYAADGRLIADLGVDLRTVLRIDEMAPALRAAFIAIEDKRFYEHRGIDYRRILGAAAADLRCFCRAQGFSTITMQLARNVFPDQLPRGKTIARKVREVQVALELERTYDKDRIFELYLNQIFLGRRYHGVESASQAYFGKSARDLNVAEAALLAGMTQVPNRYDPTRFPERAVRRRNLVINLMRNQGYIDSLQAEIWKAHPLELDSRSQYDESGSYFVEWIRQELFQR
ncbi:MAG: transglycosylase domain-containing protein, partial [Gemmatimonadales bacterium]